MNKINIFRYIGHNNPKGAYEMLIKAGYENIKKDREYVSALLAHYVANEGEKALAQIMLIHPDKEAIESLNIKKVTGEKGNGDFLNFNEDCPFKSADGDEATSKPQLSEKTINMLIIGGSVVLASTLLALIITNIQK